MTKSRVSQRDDFERFREHVGKCQYFEGEFQKGVEDWAEGWHKSGEMLFASGNKIQLV